MLKNTLERYLQARVNAQVFHPRSMAGNFYISGGPFTGGRLMYFSTKEVLKEVFLEHL